MKHTVLVTAFLAVLIIALAVFGNTHRGLLNGVTLQSSWFLPILIVAAIVDSVNPCAFSVLLLTVAFLSSLGRSRRNILAIGATYITGVFLIYIAIGLGIIGTLQVFDIPHFMARVGAGILILVGVINILNELWPAFPIKTKIPRAAHAVMARLMERASLQTAFVLGIFVGLSEFPCTGGPYLVILGLLHDTTTQLLGFGYLTFYNFIFVLPLIIILAVASDRKVLGTVERWKKERTADMRFYGGIAMIALGALIFLL